jgi:hypothetical protein
MAAELQTGTVFNSTRHQKSADTKGGIVRAYGFEIGIHHGVTRFSRGQVGNAESVEIHGCVWDVALGKKIRSFGENG